MTNYERCLAATHAYVGRKDCGCTVAAVVDCGTKETAKDVADFIRSGLKVERVLIDDVRATLRACKCKKLPT